jgi:hypothetical protein
MMIHMHKNLRLRYQLLCNDFPCTSRGPLYAQSLYLSKDDISFDIHKFMYMHIRICVHMYVCMYVYTYIYAYIKNY